LRFFLKGILDTANHSTETATRIMELREKNMGQVARLGAAREKAIQLLAHLYTSPMVRVKDVERITGLANPNALALVKRFADLGILRETTGKPRNRIYAYSDYISAFNPRT